MYRLLHKQHQQGYLLIEAMIALMVVSLGALGLIRFNSTLLRDSGLSKVRAEALEIAQGRLDTLRQALVLGGCDPASPPSLTLQTSNGINGQYSSKGDVDQVTAQRVDAQVCVAWNGSTTPCSEPINSRVILKSTLSCTGVGTSGQIAGEGQGEGSILSGFVRSPTGRAVTGGEFRDAIGTVDNFGNIVKVTATGDVVLLRQSDSTPLLTIKKLACETNNAPGFSTIEGKVYVQANKNKPLLDAVIIDPVTKISTQQLFVLGSDGGYCQLKAQELAGNDIIVENDKYFYADYICYVGPEWWGNIGVVRTDNPKTSERVCVGSTYGPDILNSIYTKKPQLGGVRSFRGYRDLGSNVYQTIGIGETNTAVASCAGNSNGAYANTPVKLKNHHFILTSITGNSTDSSCSSPLEKLKSIINNVTLDNGKPVTTNNDTTNLPQIISRTNPGKYYCLSDSSKGTDCAYSAGVSQPTFSTIINGTIDRGSLVENRGTITGITAGGLSWACLTNNFSDANTNGYANYTFSCNVNWYGWIGSEWSDSLTFTTTDILCNPPTSVSFTPAGSESGTTVTVDNTTKSLVLTSVSTVATQININFKIRKADGDPATNLECQLP